MIDFDIEKLRFKAKLADDIIDFGFIVDREDFFEWCTHNGLMTFINHCRSEDQDPFFVYKILQPLSFEMEHIRFEERPGWTSKIRTNPGNMLVNTTYHPKGWPSYAK